MVMLGIVTVGVVRGVPKMFRPPICRAHCAVIFAIAQLSCLPNDSVQHDLAIARRLSVHLPVSVTMVDWIVIT